MSSLSGLPGLDQMKVDAQSPEEAVQLVGSVPLSPAKEALQTDSRSGRAGVFPWAGREAPPKDGQRQSPAERLGAATWGNTKAVPSASGGLETPSDDLGCRHVCCETGRPSWHCGCMKPKPGQQQQPGLRTACSLHQSWRPWEAGEQPKTQRAAGECVALG